MLDSFKCLSMSWTLTPRCDDYTMCEWRLHTDHNSLRALVHHCILYFLQLSRAAHGFSPASFPMTSCLDNAFPSFCAFKYTFQFCKSETLKIANADLCPDAGFCVVICVSCHLHVLITYRNSAIRGSCEHPRVCVTPVLMAASRSFPVHR